MNTVNHIFLNMVLASCFIAQIQAMEPSQSNDAITSTILPNANKDTGLGTLAALKEDNLCDVFLLCIEWDKPTLQECFIHLKKLAQASKYLHNFVHTKVQESPAVKELIYRLIVEPKLKIYTQDKIKLYPTNTYQNFNALHYAAFDWDIPFIKKIIPQLKKLRKVDILNQKGKIGDRGPFFVPLDFIVNDTDTYKKQASDQEKHDLITLYLDAGAKPSLYAVKFAMSFTRGDSFMVKTTKLLASKLTCEQIDQYKHDYFYNIDYYSDKAKELNKETEEHYLKLILHNHNCTKCTAVL